LLLAVAAGPRPAAAQAIPGFDRVVSDKKFEFVNEHHWKLTGAVVLLQGDTRIYADEVDIFLNEDRAVAVGNVVFSQGANQIASDRADFNIKTKLGIFYNASGMAAFQPQRQMSRSGALAPPPVTGQNTDVYFFGETIEKIGPKKYKITHGGFTTCVQPTPRWDLHADTVVLNIDHYTMLHQAVLKVKGVPMLYTPFLYYPTKKDQRATGFLIPTYGSSTLRGQQLHNAFFWAIDRSQDATFEHEYYSLVGQGVAGEYRYNFGSGSDGNFNMHVLDQHEAVYTTNGVSRPVPGSRSYDIRGGANQMLPGNLRARASVNYFSSIATNQTFNTNVYDASRNSRVYGGNIVGAWGGYSLNGTYDRSEYFYDTTNSAVVGGAPRIGLSRSERPLLGSPVYFSVGTEYVYLLKETKSATHVDNQDLTRLDVTPQIRFPFKKWQWFTVNSSLNWRDTYYTRSYDPATVAPGQTPVVIDRGLNRRFFTAQAQMVGPVFNRIFDTPDNGYAEKFKHTIEPFLTLERTSSIDNYKQIVVTEGIDSIVGDTTQYTYGVNNRIYAKRAQGPGMPSSAREIVSVSLTQTYYTNGLASQFDTRYATSFSAPYATSFSGAPPSNFSPIQLSVRAMPSNDFNATLSAEFDSRYHSLRTISANSSYSWTNRLQTTVGWSKRFLILQLPGFDDTKRLDHYINTSTNVHTKDNRFGGVYSFNYDVLHSAMLQQRASGFYNAQCCGIAFEYQSYNFSGLGSFVPIPADHRFFLSFTLAGLGNFSPFNGALSGVPR
jgi:LPS-assembly protein